MTSDRGGPGPPILRRGQPWLWGLAAALIVAALVAGAWTQTDLDRDGLDVLTERSHGTDPLLADSDGDGLPDGWEIDRGTDPLDRDTDGDGLHDGRELADGWDPLAADTDGDGLDDPAELEIGTDLADPDTDDDQLDDRLEGQLGTHPLRADSDEDGLTDAQDLLAGADPLDADTDHDTLPDEAEVLAGNRDCDGDGIPAVAEADGDDDARLDAQEPEDQRCEPDVDGDGVRDGHELNIACVTLTDCDVDGIPDGQERTTRYDPLDPDTFDVGLLDGISLAFEERGQAPSRDEDEDGIPDAWEGTTGLIDWGPFDPQPGQRDLLIEFLRVEGPDSSRYRSLDLTPSYRRVETFFEDEGHVEVQWVETNVGLEAERRPPLLPSGQAGYYRGVLANASHAANPYVTSVVMNPQHNQSEILHLGVAPIRGMLAAVDYGAHTTIHFRIASNDERTTLSPFLESVIAAGHEVSGPNIQASGIDANGRMFLAGQDWTLKWVPLWFSTNPVYQTTGGFQTVFVPEEATVDHGELSYTIAHELGHTLGLCHTDLTTCQAGLPSGSRGVLGISTMDRTTQDRTQLEFLEAEWDQVHTFLTCPPVRPIRLVSEEAGRQAIIDAKYEITLENVLDVGTRECQVHLALPRDLRPAASPTTYHDPHRITEDQLLQDPEPYRPHAGDQAAPAVVNSQQRTVTYAVLGGLASVLTGVGAWGAAWWARGRWQP